MDIYDWARQEVQLAGAKMKGNDKDDIMYMTACYGSALKAYKSLIDDDHSGMSFSITSEILEKLLHRIPLTPIEDTPIMWNRAHIDGNEATYQHKRMSSLFKIVNAKTGVIRFSDNNRVICKNTIRPYAVPFCNNFVTKVIDGMFPIEFPYTPKKEPYVVYVTEFLTDTKNGYFDTMNIVSVKLPTGEMRPINLYYKEENGRWSLITQDEWIDRKKKAFERKK